MPRTSRYSFSYSPSGVADVTQEAIRAREARFTGDEGETDASEFPIYDLGRIRELAQEQAAVGRGRARRGLREALAARDADVRGAIRGFGEAQAGIQAGATRTAAQLYQPEYMREVAAFERAEREREREEAKEERRGRLVGGGGGGETYREAAARLEAYDPFGTAGRTTTTAAPVRTARGGGAFRNYSSQIAAGTGINGAAPAEDAAPTGGAGAWGTGVREPVSAIYTPQMTPEERYVESQRKLLGG